MIVGFKFFWIREYKMEDPVWRIHDYENGIISFYCGDIEVLQILNLMAE